MALKLSKTVPSGFECTYWVIGLVIGSYFEGKMRVSLAGYKDEAARRAGCMPAGSMNVEIPFSGVASKPVVYPALKQAPEFAGAEDVFEPGQP